MSRRITKLFNIDIKSVNEADRQITFCFSDDGEDRMGEVVDQASWDVKNYMNNPLILWGHDPSEPENVLGQGISINLNQGGKSYITAQFDDVDTNPKADMVFRQLLKRTLRCVSAGFINHTFETDNDTPVLKDNELLEVSIVPIPANPRAMALALEAGDISQKDAKWLLASMKKEAEFIEHKLKDQEHNTEKKSMTEEQATALMEAVTKLGETVAANQAAVDEKLAELTAKVTPPEETEEEKTAREAKEAEDKAEAEKKTADEQAAKEAADKEAADKAEADKKAAEEAAAGQVDDDTEVTPEMQAEIDKTLEEQVAAEAETVHSATSEE